MRNLRESLLLGLGVVGLLAACGSDNKASPDAAKPIDAGADAAKLIDAPITIDSPPAVADTSCKSTPYPTSTTAATITIAGTAVTQSLSGGDITGAVLTAKDASNTTIVTTGNPHTITMQESNGSASAPFSFTVPTNLMPVDGHILATRDDLRTTYVYPPNPLVADQAGVFTLMLSQSTFDTLAQIGGASEGANQGSLVIVAVDCQQNPVEGATIKVQQGGADVGMIRYSRPFMFAGMTIPVSPSSSAMSTDNTGTIFVFGVPSTDTGKETVITVTQNSVDFRPHTVKTFTTSMSTTVVVP